MVNVFEKDYSYSEIFDNLKNENVEDFVKISSIINIEKISSKEDFNLLLYHLTNHPTPIREITALKLEEISKNQIEYFLDNYSKEQIIKAIIDINPNISRSICTIINENSSVQNLIQKELIEKIFDLIEEIKKYQEENNDFCEQKNKKSHAKNKKLFALYWYLEALSSCLNDENNSQALEIVKYTLSLPDYTIREKSAKILAKMPNPTKELLQKAKSDQNFYVKNLVYDKINSEID